MKQLLLRMQQAIFSGEAAVLVTIVSQSGSAPRGVGAAMVVLQNGEQIGTIGGGSLEFRAAQRAREQLNGAADAVFAYDVHADHATAPDDAGGGVCALFRCFSGEIGLRLLEKALSAIENGDDAYLVCPIQGSAAGESSIVNAEQMKAQFQFAQLPEQAFLTAGESSWLIEPLRNAARVILFGGGHVAQKMAQQLAFLDYRVWVVEDRAEYANKALFPMAERIVFAPYAEAEEKLSICARDHAIVMARGHETDYAILSWLLKTPVDYVGCIGSKRKIQLTREKLLMDGYSERALSRLHAPIGLNIGAETPGEIAVSVAAEMIAYLLAKRQRNQSKA